MKRAIVERFPHLLSGIFLLCLVHAAAADKLVIESPAHQVALLELYTSEGCSSCPPADRWVSSLKDNPGLWHRFIPLSFHVDYWDYIGWPDRFASPAFTERQYQHASDQSMRTVYTPGFFLNGLEWRWRGRDLSEDILAVPAGVLQLEATAEELNLSFESNESGRTMAASVALLGFGIETQVKAGENAGRKLNHDFVVLAVNSAPMRREGDVYRASLSTPSTDIRAARYALVGWVNTEGSQAPIQAAGGWWQNMKSAVSLNPEG